MAHPCVKEYDSTYMYISKKSVMLSISNEEQIIQEFALDGTVTQVGSNRASLFI